MRSPLTPAGRPVKKGWISSPYGYRKDPKTGKRDFHHGVDVASKENSDVIAVAAGVVTWVGEKSGYGILVELRHADGYTTRYGHNNKALVQAGDMVAKGQVIALVGSTGRSTGPHVHFEIARGGKALNPHKYLKMVN
ncbi:MAG: M23 family metallopeptidase [Candidatus Sedimenticola endophacoides]